MNVPQWHKVEVSPVLQATSQFHRPDVDVSMNNRRRGFISNQSPRFQDIVDQVKRLVIIINMMTMPTSCQCPTTFTLCQWRYRSSSSRGEGIGVTRGKKVEKSGKIDNKGKETDLWLLRCRLPPFHSLVVQVRSWCHCKDWHRSRHSDWRNWIVGFKPGPPPERTITLTFGPVMLIFLSFCIRRRMSPFIQVILEKKDGFGSHSAPWNFFIIFRIDCPFFSRPVTVQYLRVTGRVFKSTFLYQFNLV